MAFTNVANSFPGDAVPAIAAPIIGGPPVLGVAGLGLGAVAVLGPVAPPPFLVSLELRRTVESTAVQPGFGLAPITLAPLDTAAAGPPAAFMFGTHSASFNAVAPPIAGTVEPFMLCPGDGAPVSVRWAVRHAAAGFTASLDLYRATRRNMPFWFCTFANNGGVNLANTVAWIPGGGALPNHTYYETTFNGNVTAPGAGITPDGSGFFPGGWLDSESGPYKFVLTITGPGGVQHRRAWTYFQVPAHKFKLLRYVPSTEFGCFGLEFDPTKPDLKVITRAYYGYESAGGVVPAFLPAGMNRHATLYQRIFKEWGAQYAMRVGVNSHRPLVFAIAHANAAVPNIAAPVSSFGAVITPIVRAAQADFPVIFTNMPGGSGVVPSAQGHFLRLYVPSAFEETENNGMRKGQIHDKDMATVKSAIQNALRSAPANIGFEQDIDSGSIFVGMPESSVDPDNATANWLPNLSAALNACISLLSGPIEVFFSGISKNGRPANGKRSRTSVSRVKAIVAATLRTPAPGLGGLPAQAADRRQAAAGFHIAGDAVAAGTGVRRQVRIDFGRRPGPAAGPVPPAFPYIASVHEFGHVFGFPDEYMDYTFPLKNCLVIARSQGRIDQLAALFNVASFAWPVGNTENMNPNLMSLGTVFHERYYLTFFEALSKLLFLGAANPPVYNGPAARDHDIAHFPVPEDPAFNPIANLLRTAADAFEAAAGPPLETRADLRARIVADCAVVPVAQNLLYLNALDSDAVVLALATGRNLRRHFIQTGILVQNECLHCAIQVEALKPIINLVIFNGVLLNSVPFPLAGAPRIKATLRAVRAFAGTGRINFNPPGIVTAHTAAAAGALVNPGPGGTALPGTAVLGALAHANGMDVWLEGVAQGVTDMTLELYNAAGLLIAQTEPVRILCGPPVEVLIDRKPIGTAVAMPLQGCANSTFPFTEIRLRKIAPGITGVNLCRVAKVVAGGANFTLHNAPNGAALVMPYDVPDAAYDNNEETLLYLAGTVRSAAAGDGALTFAAGAGAVFTIVLVTVVDIVNLEVLLTDSTPVTARTVGMTFAAVPRTTSGGPQLPNAAVLRTYRPHLASHGFADFGRPAPAALIAARRANYGSEDFAVNSPLVLIERSIPAPGANIRATVHPLGIAAHWYVERNDDDNDRLATLGAALPALIPLAPVIAGPDLEFTAQVEPNSVGSFHLRLSLNNDRDDILTFNVVIVRAIALNLDASRANVPRRHHVMEKKLTAPNAAADMQHIHVSSGDWPGAINQPAESGFACVLRGDVHLIGGGADGLLGQDCVFAGWIQNLVQFTVQADYTDSAAPGHIRTLAMQVGGNQEEGALRTNNDRYFVNGGAALARLQPLVANGSEIMLDTGRPTAGGSSILLSNSAADAPVADDTIGWRMRASAADSPGTEFFLRHPSRATAFLTSMEYIHIFRSFLSVWTDGTAPALASINGGHPLHGAGNRIFTCCGDLRWRVNGAWRVNVGAGAWRGAGAGAIPVLANSVLVHRVRNISVTIQQPFVPFPAALPASNLAETKLPAMVASFSWNAIW